MITSNNYQKFKKLALNNPDFDTVPSMEWLIRMKCKIDDHGYLTIPPDSTAYNPHVINPNVLPKDMQIFFVDPGKKQTDIEPKEEKELELPKVFKRGRGRPKKPKTTIKKPTPTKVKDDEDEPLAAKLMIKDVEHTAQDPKPLQPKQHRHKEQLDFIKQKIQEAYELGVSHGISQALNLAQTQCERIASNEREYIETAS